MQTDQFGRRLLGASYYGVVSGLRRDAEIAPDGTLERLSRRVKGLSVQSARRRLRGLLDPRGDRTCLMMDHPPRAIDGSEPVGRGERQFADDFDAKDPGFDARRQDLLILMRDLLLRGVA